MESTGLPTRLLDNVAIGFLAGLSQVGADTDLRAEEFLSCLAQSPISDHARTQWYGIEISSLSLRASDQCDSGCREACESLGGYVHPAPDGLVDFAAIQNRITSPTLCEVDSVRVIRSGQKSYLHFSHDPFLDAGWSVSDRESFGRPYKVIRAWLHLASFQAHYFRRFLSPLTLLGQTAPPEVQQAVMRIRQYPTPLAFRVLLGAITRSPVSEYDDSVLAVRPAEQRRNAIVITERGTYHGGAGVSPVVSSGDELHAGDLLFDGFDIAELSHETPDWTTELKIPGSYLADAEKVPFITLSMLPQSVEIESGSRATFNVGIHSESYWDYVYGRSDELSAAAYASISGRSSIVPFEFFRNARLRYGGVAARLRGELIADSVNAVRMLYRFLPPHRSLFLDITDPVPKELRQNPPPCCTF